jgi:hypothetical protein
MPCETGLRDELDQLHRDVGDRHQQEEDPADRVGRRLDVAERRDQEFVQPAAEALDLDAVVEDQDQHADREAHRDRQVGGRHDAQVGVRRVVAGRTVDPAPDDRQQVDRQQVHRVQQERPDEHRSARAGPTNLRLVALWTMFFASLSTSSKRISTAAWKRPGTPAVALRAASQSTQQPSSRSRSRRRPNPS